MPDVNNIDLSIAEIIACASSEDRHQSGAQRWTELEVYHRPGQSPRFVAQSIGVSTYTGESERIRRLGGSTLGKVLRLFAGVDGNEPTPLGKVVIAEAQAWERSQGFKGTTVTEALAWLYDGLPIDEALASRASRDLGITERPVQKAVKAEDAGERATLTVPLIALLPYIDRDRFQASSSARAAAAKAGG